MMGDRDIDERIVFQYDAASGERKHPRLTTDSFERATTSTTEAPFSTKRESEEFWRLLAEQTEDDGTIIQVPESQRARRGSKGMSEDAIAIENASRASSGREDEVDANTVELSPEELEELKKKQFEETCQRIREALNKRPAHKEILRRILVFCRTAQPFDVVEDEIQTFPEFEHSGQNPFRFNKYLLDCGGLILLDLDEEGNLITEEQKAGKTVDEIDDMIFSFALETTEAGNAVAEEHDPTKRLETTFRLFGDRKHIFTELLNFCKQPHNYFDIEKHFAGWDFTGLKTTSLEKSISLKPSVFVVNMEEAGGIVWKNNSWMITKEGEAMLEKLLSAVEV